MQKRTVVALVMVLLVLAFICYEVFKPSLQWRSTGNFYTLKQTFEGKPVLLTCGTGTVTYTGEQFTHVVFLFYLPYDGSKITFKAGTVNVFTTPELTVDYTRDGIAYSYGLFKKTVIDRDLTKIYMSKIITSMNAVSICIGETSALTCYPYEVNNFNPYAQPYFILQKACISIVG